MIVSNDPRTFGLPSAALSPYWPVVVTRADVFVRHQNGGAILEPLTARARRWLDKRVEVEEWQWVNGSLGGLGLVVDGECVPDLLDGMDDSGLEVVPVVYAKA